jgi:hypothetical protein
MVESYFQVVTTIQSIMHISIFPHRSILSNEEEEEVYRFFDQIGWALPSLGLP